MKYAINNHFAVGMEIIAYGYFILFKTESNTYTKAYIRIYT